MKRIYLSVAIIGVVLAGCAPVEENEDKKVPIKQVGAADLAVEDYSHWVELQGALESDDDVMLTPQTAGTISRIYVKEGQKVRQGSLIAYMDSEIISSNIDEVQTALQNAEYVYDKQVSLYNAKVGTEFDTTQAYNQVQSLRRKIETLKRQAGKSAVVAPFTGYVEEIYPSQGEVGGPQAPICHLVGLRSIQASAAISESYFEDIREGSVVRINIPALDTMINDSITRVSRYVNPGNRTYQIHIDLNNQSEELVPNLVAKIQVRDKFFKNALVVDSKSIQYDKDGNTYVYWLEPKTKESKEGKSDKKTKDDKKEPQKYIAHIAMVEKRSSYAGKTAIRKIGDIPEGAKIVNLGAEGIQDGEEVVISF